MEQKLSREDIAVLRKKLASMSITGVADFYHSAYLRCALKEKSPDPRTVQEFIQAWKEIRKRSK
jgi:hypothetical protein